MAKGIVIPTEMFQKMLNTYYRMEQIIATLETMADKETMKAVKKSKEEIQKGEFIECKIDELNKVLS
ncbi:MAG TPA: hypothetical protein VJ249_02780 [Candidatus Bathyarchaeia archaeon]|nr:hypothetical protein [Candidatus Bathyarchaeia archaeon]